MHLLLKIKNSFSVIIIIFLSSCNYSTPKQEGTRSEQHIDYSELRHVLDSIHSEDQRYRKEIESIALEYGWESEEISKHWERISKVDSSNQIIVKGIIDEFGWLGPDQIGSKANQTLFLVIQHSNKATQKQYLPAMREAVEMGKARSQSLALLEDRVALGQGELQIYGSQIGRDEATCEFYVLPMIEPEKVNDRRSAVGLESIEDYISTWAIDWDLESYKNQLPKRIKDLDKRPYGASN